ncbi:type II toxin-antitoxin system VapC family toxin [Roseococcus sp. DSY-14]|uniref:type II toxin-antitoxin system VapC family toxin n=1 Tax=Roseococcus sp. DSY-14 TaxID=3369650 RepID=UPI00387AD310
MIVDTSALAAILFQEGDARRYAGTLVDQGGATLSVANLVELTMVVEGRAGNAAGTEVDDLLHRFGIHLSPVTRRQAELARAAWRRYGKGRHPAALNLGDCFAYALAAERGEPLLFKGEDFARTDVKAAL